MAGPQDGMGDQWDQGGMRYTVNPADDPKAGPDGYYLSMMDLETGDHSTAVYDGNDNLLSFGP